MGQHVCLEGTGLCAGEVALFASKRLLSTVNHVSFQMIGLDGVATQVATVRLLYILLKNVYF